MIKPLVGKNGWLFLSDDTNNVVGQHTGTRKLSSESLDKWLLIFGQRRNFCKSLNIPYFFAIAPDTHAVYPEFLPDDIIPTKTRPVNIIIQSALEKENFNIIYPLDDLKKEKERNLVCQTSDSHTSQYGGFVLAQAILQSISEKIPVQVPSVDNIKLSSGTRVGDLGNKFNPQIVGQTTFAAPRENCPNMVYYNEVTNNGAIRIYKNTNSKQLKCLVFGDSYGAYISPFMALSFSRLVQVNSIWLDREIILLEKPDVVVSVMAERFCILPPDDTKSGTFADLIKDKLNIKELNSSHFPWIQPTLNI